MTPGRGESGQTMLLVVGMVLVCFAVAGLAVDITRAGLLRRSLQSAADSAATAGASQLDEVQYYEMGGRSTSLHPGRARSSISAALRARRDLASVRVNASSRSVTVEVGGRLRTSFLRLIGVRHLAVRAVASAEPVLGES